MWLSRPITASKLRSPISPSTATTRRPIIASAVLRLAAVVVLPTPPLPDVIVSTRLSMLPPQERASFTGGKPARHSSFQRQSDRFSPTPPLASAAAARHLPAGDWQARQCAVAPAPAPARRQSPPHWRDTLRGPSRAAC